MPFALLLTAGIAFTSCSKEVKNPESNEISEDVLTKIQQHGFGISNVQKHEDGYLVEGDIILDDEYLNTAPGGHYLRIANNEQYRTTSLVTGTPRTIMVATSGSVSTNVSNAVDAAIARYNAENLGLIFQRVSSGAHITIKVVNGGSYIASAGFPTSSGAPYNQIKFNKKYQTWQLNTLTSVFAHEMGHCIGFRHTDYMDRSFSCGGSPTNEGASTVGAVHIPGTPTGADSGSWMLACIGNGTNRPFNNNDKTALNYLY